MKSAYFAVILLFLSLVLKASEPKSVYDVPADIVLPAVVQGEPEVGKQVRMTTPGWTETCAYHSLYLPKNWTCRTHRSFS